MLRDVESVDRPPEAPPLLRAGTNVWREVSCARARVLVDGAEYFDALRRTLRAARRSILIAGWDIDSRTPLVGPDGGTPDGLPRELGAFLSHLVAERPELDVKLLLWDYSVLYALEREFMPVVALQWSTPKQIELCLDDIVPVGSSHHQKIVVVDDAVAFSGGLDLTIRRWDDGRHQPDDPKRVDPAGKPYPPFHDVQMMVDGEAAAALGDLVRERWARAAHERLPAPKVESDPWPEAIAPEFTDVRIGIARTQPQHGSIDAVNEIERLFLDMIAVAERSLYIENQFLTSPTIGAAIAERMHAAPALEVVLVGPKTHHTWFEHQAMLGGRIRFLEHIRSHGDPDRVVLLHPEVGPVDGATEVMVHSKVMIVDDRVLRVGSANLCNRSMGTDTECDLVVAARSPEERVAVAAVRDRLIGEHCGVAPALVSAALDRGGSIIAAIRELNAPERRLAPTDDGPMPTGELGRQIEEIADPERPPVVADLLIDHSSDPPRPARASAAWKVVIALAVVAAVALAWQLAPEGMLDHEVIERWLPGPENAWSPALVVGVFVLCGLVAFPVTILIAATAAVYGPWPGALYAAGGAVASAMVGYALGRLIGRRTVRGSLGPRVNRISESIARRGVLAVTAVRLVPIAPFAVINVVAGASRVAVLDFVAGTVLGLAPGIIVLSLLGDQVMEAVADPTWGEIGLAGLFVVVWLAASFALQWAVSRWRGSQKRADD